jgi:hypothetical protein
MALRPLEHPLVLTTLLHLLAFPDARAVSSAYGGVVLASTAASMAWHSFGEPAEGGLFVLNYGLAAAWFLLDLIYSSFQYPALRGRVLQYNLAVMAANLAVNRLTGWRYEVAHSAWHLLSATKAVWVARAFLEAGGEVLRSEA